MEQLDPVKKQEAEITKVKIDKIKNQVVETTIAISTTEQLQQKMQKECSRKISDLRSVADVQDLNIFDLSKEIEAIQSLLDSRMRTQVELMKANAELKEELETAQNKLAFVEDETLRRLQTLEETLRETYLKLQDLRDAEILYDMGLGSLPDKQQIPYLQNLIRKRKQREEEVAVELEEMNQARKQLDKELKAKVEELEVLKDKNTTLRRLYALNKTE